MASGTHHPDADSLSDPAWPSTTSENMRIFLSRSAPGLTGPALGALLAAGLLTLCQLYLSIPLAPGAARELGHPGAAGLIGTSFGLAYAVGVLGFGPLSDRHGRRRVLAWGHAGLALATVGAALAPSLPLLVACRAAQGLAAASFPPVALAYIGEHASARRRPVALAAMTSTFLLAGIVGQLYGSAVGPEGWRVALLGLAVGHAAMCAALTVTLTARSTATPGREPIARALLGALRLPRMPRLLAALSVVLLSFVALYASVGLRLDQLGASEAGATIVRLAGLPGMLLAPASGALSARLGARAVATGGLLTAAAGLLTIAVAPTLVPLAVGAAVFVAGIAATVPAFTGLVGDGAGPRRGAALALYSCTLFAGASAGNAAAAWSGLGFTTIALVLAGLLAAAAAVVASAHPRAARPSPAEIFVRTFC